MTPSAEMEEACKWWGAKVHSHYFNITPQKGVQYVEGMANCVSCRKSVCICMCVCVCAYACVCVCVHMCVCARVWGGGGGGAPPPPPPPSSHPPFTGWGGDSTHHPPPIPLFMVCMCDIYSTTLPVDIALFYTLQL